MGEIPSLDELVAQVDAVTADDVARVIDRVLGAGSRTLAVVGPADALVARLNTAGRTPASADTLSR